MFFKGDYNYLVCIFQTLKSTKLSFNNKAVQKKKRVEIFYFWVVLSAEVKRICQSLSK